jgi:hypothetical protein
MGSPGSSRKRKKLKRMTKINVATDDSTRDRV